MKYLYNPPYILKKTLSQFYWETSNNKILLTFDDGPAAETTEKILDVLNHNNLKALFFCVGNNIKKNPSLTDLILKEGHSIGNHTFSHKIILGLNKKEFNNEIDPVNTLLKEEHEYEIKYFRPPHGRFGLSTSGFIKEKKIKIIMWSLLTFDYKNDLNLVKFAVKRYLRRNSIIVFHDSIKSGKIISDSLKYLFEEIKNKNFEIGTPEECLK